MNKKKILSAFGKNLRQIRISAGMSQEELAERTHVHRTYIGMLERGEKNATLTTLLKLSGALDIPLIKIISWENNIHNE